MEQKSRGKDAGKALAVDAAMRRAEDERRSAQRLLAAIADSSDDPIFALDLAGRFILFNRAAERTSGKAAHAVLGRDETVMFPPELAARQVADNRSVIDGGASMSVEEVIPTPAGDRVFLTVKSPLRDENGKVIGMVGISRDVTARKRAEEALRRQVALTQRYLDTVQTLIVALDGAGRITMLNRAGCALLGYEASELLGRNWFETCLPQPQGATEVFAAFRRIMAGDPKERSRRESPVLCRDGRERLIAWNSTCLTDDAGAVVGILGSGEDITVRRMSEDALRESERRFHDIVTATADWIWEVDAQGRYTFASEGVHDLLGYTPAEVIGKTPFDFMPPAEAARVAAEFAAIVARREPFRDLDNINRRKDGGLRHVLTNGMPILDADGKLLGYRGLDRDITERKRAELELRESEARFRTLFDSATVGIFVHDRDSGRIVEANRRALEMFGCATLEALEEKPFAPPPYAREDAVVRIRKAAAGWPQRFEWLSSRTDGSEIWQDVQLQAVTLNGVKRVLAVTQDITARKAAEEELKRRNEELERFNRASVGRELDMVELKQRINALSRELGREPPFPLAFLDNGQRDGA